MDDMMRGGTSGPATSTSADAAPLSAVVALTDERRRFEQWLEALEARRAATPERVFLRVHADYSARRDAAAEQLLGHVGALRGELSVLAARLTELHDAELAARDALAEAELRAHVGELESGAWERTARDGEQQVSELVAQQRALDAEITRARELLQEAERPSNRSGVSMPAEPTVSAVPDSAEASVHVPEAVAPLNVAEEPGLAPPMETWPDPPTELPASVIAAEVELLNEEQGMPESSAPDTTSAPRRSNGFDEIAFVTSVVDTPSGSIDLAPTEPGDEHARRDSFAMQGMEDGIVNLTDEQSGGALEGTAPGRHGKPLAANVTGNVPIVLRDKPLEAVKSLKCGECGAANYPTEWYCERCGSELASL